MNIDNLMRIGASAEFYITINGRAMSFPISTSYDASGKNYAGFSGAGDQDMPVCIRHGAPFRYQRTFDPNLNRLPSCPEGMEMVHPSLVIRNSSSSELVVRINASGVR
jgi:hypothetical protein